MCRNVKLETLLAVVALWSRPRFTSPASPTWCQTQGNWTWNAATHGNWTWNGAGVLRCLSRVIRTKRNAQTRTNWELSLWSRPRLPKPRLVKAQVASHSMTHLVSNRAGNDAGVARHPSQVNQSQNTRMHTHNSSLLSGQGPGCFGLRLVKAQVASHRVARLDSNRAGIDAGVDR